MIGDVVHTKIVNSGHGHDIDFLWKLMSCARPFFVTLVLAESNDRRPLDFRSLCNIEIFFICVKFEESTREK